MIIIKTNNYYSRVEQVNCRKSFCKIKTANLITKTDFDDKLKILNWKINSKKIKHLVIENELKKLKTFVQFI